MLNAISVGIRFFTLMLNGHRHVALENAALRQQLAVFKRDTKRPRLHRRDRLFWIGLRTIWKNWKSALVIVRQARSSDGGFVRPTQRSHPVPIRTGQEQNRGHWMLPL